MSGTEQRMRKRFAAGITRRNTIPEFRTFRGSRQGFVQAQVLAGHSRKKGTPAKYECSGVVVSVWLIRFGIEVRSEIEIRSDRTQPIFRSVTMEIITMTARRYG